MKTKNMRVGKVVFLASNGFVEKVKIATISVENGLDDCGSLFANINDDINMFSFTDYNIIKNNYNNHRAFFTPAAAYRYARRHPCTFPHHRNLML